jgi:uncharacterized protein Yka (UPF0111/DUF47 family)
MRFETHDPAALIKAAMDDVDATIDAWHTRALAAQEEIERAERETDKLQADRAQLELALSVLWTGGVRL